MEKSVFTREELYDLIWSNTFTFLAKKYNISDVGLRKASIRLGIPVPPVGYWSKIAAGHLVAKAPLQQAGNFEKEITLSLRSESNAADELGLSRLAVLQRLLEADDSICFEVPELLVSPEPETNAARKSLSEISESYQNGDLLTTSFKDVEIRVSPVNVDRALAILDAFLKIIRKHGKIGFNGKEVIIEEEKLKVKILEVQDKRDVNKGNVDPQITLNGKLTLKFENAYVSAKTSDGKVPLEKALSKVLAKLMLLAERFIAESEAREEWSRNWAEKRRIEAEHENRKREELDGLKTLLKDFRRFEEVKRLRAYLTELEAIAVQKGSFNDDFLNYLNWAKKKADWLDPSVEASDEWLVGVDREMLLEATSPKENRGHGSISAFSGWPLKKWYSKT